MFLPVARLRLAAAAVLAVAPITSAHLDSLFASSVSYCAPPESLLVDQFDIAYYPSNNSVVFNVSAASVETNVSVNANLYLNVYGMRPVNLTLDLCSLLDAALCPLPLYDFQGADAIPLPKSVDIASHLPGIAYKIPDLEAFAQLSLYEVDTGDQKACIQITLSNGWSTRQSAVSWALGGLALFALASASWQSFRPDSLAPHRLLDLIGLYQIIAASALLNLNYPVVYRSFALNFSWALGLFAQSGFSSIQMSIDHMRNLTGGTVVPPAVGGATALVNRRLSPYNEPGHGNFIVSSAELASRSVPTLSLVTRDVQVVTSTSGNALEAGVPIFAESINVPTENAFMTVFFSALILFAVSIGVLAIVCGFIWLGYRYLGKHFSDQAGARQYHITIVYSWILRVLLACLFPLLIFAFYQWTLRDSWLATFISVISFVAVATCVLYCIFRIFSYTRRSPPDLLVADLPHLSPFYGQYRVPRYYAFLVPISASFFRALFIAFAKGSETAQITLMVIVEALCLGAACVLRPGRTKGADVLSIYLAIVRLVCTGLLIAYVERLDVAPIPRVAVGIVTAVIWSIAVIVLFFNTLVNLSLSIWFPHRNGWILRLRSLGSDSQSTQLSSERKDEEVSSYSSTDLSSTGRRNPTPLQNTRLDPQVNKPYPTITPTTTAAEPPSASTATSYGHQIESQWRSPSRPPSSLSGAYSGTPQSSAFGVTPPSTHGGLSHPPISEDHAA